MTDGRDRRSVLRAGGALCSIGLAGCLGDSGEGDDSNRTDADGDPNDTDPDGNATDPDDNSSDPDDDSDQGDDPPATVDAWPQYQYDAQNSGTVAASGPTENVEECWNHALDAEIHASPVVGNGTVYVVDRGGTVRAFEAEEGDVRWQEPLDATVDGTPALTADHLLVPAHDAIYALDPAAGDEQWREPVEGAPSDLTLYDGGVAFAVAGVGVRMLDAATGAERWLVRGESSAQTFVDGLAAANDALYTNDRSDPNDDEYRDDDSDFVYRVDPATGSGLPYKQVLDGLNSAPGSDGDLLVFGGQNGIYAFRDDDGLEQVWEEQLEDATYVAPCVTDEYVVVNSATNVHVFDLETGEEKWQKETDLIGVRGGIVADGNVYFSNDYAEITCYDVESGEQRWKAACDSADCFTRVGVAYPRPAFAEERVFVCGVDGTVKAFEEKNG